MVKNYSFISTNSIDNTVQTSAENLTTTTEKKLNLSRAQLRAKSTSTTPRG